MTMGSSADSTFHLSQIDLPVPDLKLWKIRDRDEDFWPEDDGMTPGFPPGYPEITPKIFLRQFRRISLYGLDPVPEFWIIRNPNVTVDKYIMTAPYRHPEYDWIPNLGNQIFQFVGTSALAFNGEDAYHLALDTLTFHNFSEVFDVSAWPIKKDIEYVYTFPNYNCCAHTPAYEAALRNETIKKSNINISIPGHLQSHKYFHPSFLSPLRRLLKFRGEIRTEAEAIQKATVLSVAKKINLPLNAVPTTVGIHVRRDDIVTNHTHVEHGHKPAGMDYFERAISFFKGKFPNAVFVLISNDMTWCKEHFGKFADVGFVEYGGNFTQPQRAGIDMCVMTLCDHMIMSVGTYSWWGAYLPKVMSENPRERVVTYCDDWPRRGTKMDVNLRREDYFLPEWIPM